MRPVECKETGDTGAVWKRSDRKYCFYDRKWLKKDFNHLVRSKVYPQKVLSVSTLYSPDLVVMLVLWPCRSAEHVHAKNSIHCHKPHVHRKGPH